MHASSKNASTASLLRVCEKKMRQIEDARHRPAVGGRAEVLLPHVVADAHVHSFFLVPQAICPSWS